MTTVLVESTGAQLQVLPTATPDDLRRHLIEDHGMPAGLLDAHEVDEHALWHAAEHRTRDPKPTSRDLRHSGHLTHTHQERIS